MPEKLSLADSVGRLLHVTWDDSWLEELGTRPRGRGDARDRKFRPLAHRITAAWLEPGGSGPQAFERAHDAALLRVAITSADPKLGNRPVAVSETPRRSHREDERGPA